ncbi:hypothetical protein ATANTOWER_021111, partial [Ataeniobius toweri]|nr:hypothetical protein [Ataeniobius toweri]
MRRFHLGPFVARPQWCGESEDQGKNPSSPRASLGGCQLFPAFSMSPHPSRSTGVYCNVRAKMGRKEIICSWKKNVSNIKDVFDFKGKMGS